MSLEDVAWKVCNDPFERCESSWELGDVRCRYTPDLLEMVSFYWKWCHSLWKLQLGVGFNGFHLSPHQGRSNFLKNSSGIMGKHFGSCCKWAQYRLQQLRAYIDHKEEWDWISYASTRKLGTGPHSWQPSIDDPQRCQVSKHAQVGVKDSLGGPIYKVVSSVLHCLLSLDKDSVSTNKRLLSRKNRFCDSKPSPTVLAAFNLKNPVPNGLQHGGFVKNEQTHSVVGYIGRFFGRGPGAEWPIDLIPNKMTSKEIPEKIHRRWATSLLLSYKRPKIHFISFPKGMVHFTPFLVEDFLILKKKNGFFGAHLVRIYKGKNTLRVSQRRW